MKFIRNGNWELVMHNHLEPMADQPWGDLYRFPIYRGVPAGESFYCDYSMREFTAPAGDGTYTLYKYVQGGTLQKYGWEKES